MTEFPATVHHVALTVTDLEVSRQWYQRLLNAAPVLDEDVPALPSTTKGSTRSSSCCPAASCWGWSRTLPPTGPRFDEFGPGLDHLGFGCADRSELETWQDRLDELGIATAPSPRTPRLRLALPRPRQHRPGALGPPLVADGPAPGMAAVGGRGRRPLRDGGAAASVFWSRCGPR